jgi:hypothetical protein
VAIEKAENEQHTNIYKTMNKKKERRDGNFLFQLKASERKYIDYRKSVIEKKLLF